MTSLIKLFPIAIVFLMLTGCSLFGDDCSKCQKAIDHMHENIAALDCNPNFMENAVQRIENDCDEATAVAVIEGLVENCHAQGGTMICEASELFQLELTIVNTTDLAPPGLETPAVITINQGKVTTKELQPGEQETVYLDVVNNTSITVEWIDLLNPSIDFATDDILVQRRGRYFVDEWNTREVWLGYDPAEAEYQFFPIYF